MIANTFLIAVAEILHMLIYAYIIVIFVACILSFVNPDPYNKIVQIIYRLSEPSFNLVRRFINTVYGGLDIAPIIVWIILMFIDKFIIRLLFDFAHSF